jgi:hypothetical protein
MTCLDFLESGPVAVPKGMAWEIMALKWKNLGPDG